jgi:hypothetical protein
MAKKCEQCGGVHAKAYERCPECAPQPSVPSGEAAAELVAYVRSVYTNVPYSDFSQGWHEACDAITRLLAAPPQERVSEEPNITLRMVKEALREFCAQSGDSFDLMWDGASDVARKELYDNWRHILRAALAPSRTEGK